jgi:protein ImuA
MTPPSLQQSILEDLKQQLSGLEAVHRPKGERFSSGCGCLDLLLAGGLSRGSLVEYLAGDGEGAATLAVVAARESSRSGGAVVVIDRQIYPPALHDLGIDIAKTIFVRPTTKKDLLWALHQSLSCRGVTAVLSWPDKLDDRTYRSLQLAAEKSGALGLFIRPLAMRGQPTWSELQLLVQALPAISRNRRFKLEITRRRNGRVGDAVYLEFDDDTCSFKQSNNVRLVSPMAVAAGAEHSPRASKP